MPEAGDRTALYPDHRPEAVPGYPQKAASRGNGLVSLYEKYALQFFPMDDILGGGNLYLGGGCGFFSKTVLYPSGEQDGLRRRSPSFTGSFRGICTFKTDVLGSPPYGEMCEIPGNCMRWEPAPWEVQPFSADV